MRDAAGEAADRLHLLHALQPDLVAGAPGLQLAGIRGQDRAQGGDAIEGALDHRREARDVLGADVVPGAATQRPQHFLVIGRRIARDHHDQRRRRAIVADTLEETLGEVIRVERADDQQIAGRDAEQRHRVRGGHGVGDDRFEIEARQAGQEAAAGRDRIVGEHDGKGAGHRARAVPGLAGSRYPAIGTFPKAPEPIGGVRRRRRAMPCETAQVRPRQRGLSGDRLPSWRRQRRANREIRRRSA